MTINEKLISEIKDYCKLADEYELRKMVDGLYIFCNLLIHICNDKRNLFKVNSFPRRFKCLLIDFALIIYNELNERKKES